MKERFATVGTLVCLTVLTCLTLVFALAIFPGTDAIRWFFATCAVVISRLDAPAWVQAIAAAIAIVAGAVGLYWQAGQQHRLEAARITNEEVRRLRIMWSAVVDLRIRLKASTGLELGPFQTDWDRVDEAVRLLREVPLFEVPDWRVAFATTQALDSYAYLRRQVPFRGANMPSAQWYKTAYDLVDSARAHCLLAQQHIEEAIRLRRAEVPYINVDLAGGGSISSKDE